MKNKPCQFFKSIHDRNDGTFCLRVECETHLLKWNAIDTWDNVVLMMREFPLVSGGLLLPKGLMLIDKACELNCIPALLK